MTRAVLRHVEHTIRRLSHGGVTAELSGVAHGCASRSARKVTRTTLRTGHFNSTRVDGSYIGPSRTVNRPQRC
ncbi:hypothetical protein, partial [Streptomyces sp. NPDC058572]|uniref:hypothetical protein n=1 Tax=Streptomyces sp. NPDC058572 TaxID=3346546 RepID=UPI003654E487